MHNYYTGLIWKIDAILLSACLVLAVMIILNTIIREYSWRMRNRALLGIKRHVYEMVLAGKEVNKDECDRLIAVSTPQQFLDVTTNRNRELIFFNDQEQDIFKKHFLSLHNIKRLKKTARNPGNKWRRIEAIMGLGYADVAEAAAILKKTLFSKDEDMAYFSMIALGQLKNTESAAALVEFFKKNPLWRYKLISILEKFSPQITDEIIKLIKDKDPVVRSWAVKLLSKFDLTGHINTMKALSKDESPEVRGALCECLGRSGLKSAEDILVAALEDDSWFVRASAVKALSRLLGKKCVPIIAKLANDGSLSVITNVKDVLAEYIESAIPHIEKFMSSENDMARKIAVEVLERSGYIGKVLEMLISSDPEVSKKAGRLISDMIKAGARIGLEGSIEMLEEKSRARAIDEIGKIDADFAGYMQEKLKSGIKE